MTKIKSLESTLQEVEGIPKPTTTNDNSINKIKQQRSIQPSEKVFVERILAGDISYLSRAITLIESKNPKQKTKANAILEQCLPFTNNSIRIGITGVPGVGKSTFIEAFEKYFTEKGKKVAGAGDNLQGIKHGIIEITDTIVINKAVKENIKQAIIAKIEFSKALHLYPPKESNWQPKVNTYSAIYNEGIDAIYKIINDYFNLKKANGYFEKRRNEQNNYWLLETINQQLIADFYFKPAVK